MKEIFISLSNVSKFFNEKRVVYYAPGDPIEDLGGDIKINKPKRKFPKFKETIPQDEDELNDLIDAVSKGEARIRCNSRKQGKDVFDSCMRRIGGLKKEDKGRESGKRQMSAAEAKKQERSNADVKAYEAGVASKQRPKSYPAPREVKLVLSGEIELPSNFKVWKQNELDKLAVEYIKKYGNVEPSEEEVMNEMKKRASGDDLKGSNYVRQDMIDKRIKEQLPGLKVELESNMKDDVHELMVTKFVCFEQYDKKYNDNATYKKAMDGFEANMASNTKMLAYLPKLKAQRIVVAAKPGRRPPRGKR